MIFVTRIEYVFVAYTTYIIIIIMTKESKEPPKNHCHWFTILSIIPTYENYNLYYIGVYYNIIRPLANGADKFMAVSGPNDLHCKRFRKSH